MERIRRFISGILRLVRLSTVTGCMVGMPILCLGSENSSTAPPPIVVTRSTAYATAGFPFSALVSKSGAVLVSVTADGSTGSATGVQVFEPQRHGLTPRCVNVVPPSLATSATAQGLSLFDEGRDAAVGLGSPGTILYHVKDLVACNANGYVVPQGSVVSSNTGTFSVAVTRDGKFAFVAEYGITGVTDGYVGVVAIERDVFGNFTGETIVIGQIPTGGIAVADVTLSPDGTRLYATTEVAASNTVASGSDNPILSSADCVAQGGGINGLLTVIDVAAAERNPNSAAILSTVAAGCSPVRVVETRDQSTLWVSARGDDRVLAFSTRALESNPDHALLGYADSGGTAPVGIRLFHDDRFLAVANSNRFGTGDGNATILDVSCVTSASVVQTIYATLFPREINVAPDDSTLYLTDYLSEAFQVIETATRDDSHHTGVVLDSSAGDRRCGFPGPSAKFDGK